MTFVKKAIGYISYTLSFCLFAAIGFTSTASAQLANGQVPIIGKTIPKYVEPLPHFANIRIDGTQDLTVTAKETTQQVLPAPNPALGIAGYPETKVWGYEIDDGSTSYGPLYPAYTIEAHRGAPIDVTYVNGLENQTLYTPVSPDLPGILPVDQTMHWADPYGDHQNGMPPMTTYEGPVPIVTHLHGGEVSSLSDGGPDAWFTPGLGITGPAWDHGVTNVYTYPNSQEAATLWFHDHALGVTRLNVYAGLAGFYLLRDADDNGAVDNPIGLPAGDYEIEIVIQDRMFDTQGQLYFPNLGINPTIHPFWIPEFMGDVIVVNGKTWPYLEVEPRRYRFRFLNGSNARFYTMFLENMVTLTPGPVFWQIGTDGGLLDVPEKIDPNDPLVPMKLLMAPGERADIIIDFTNFAGQTLTVLNNARTPYPKGVPADPQTVGQIMQFRVTKPLTGTDVSYDPSAGTSLRQPLVKLVNFTTAQPLVAPDIKRQLTLNEAMGLMGPLEVLVNNAKWGAQTSEITTEGNTEIWEIINLTADAHPIHLHLVQFQLVSRRMFNVNKYLKAYAKAYGGIIVDGNGPPLAYNTPNADGALGGNPAIKPYLQGPARPAERNERGWKDTFIMYPGEVTTVIARFSPTDLPITTTKGSLVFQDFNPSEGPGYVWHCHIIDHEDNEMMRPYSVMPNPSRIPPKTRNQVLSENIVVNEFSLSQNYPNPFNPSTEIHYSLPSSQFVNLRVYNMLGQEVATLVNEIQEAGAKSVTFNADNLPSGMYTYRISAGAYSAIKSMIVVK